MPAPTTLMSASVQAGSGYFNATAVANRIDTNMTMNGTKGSTVQTPSGTTGASNTAQYFPVRRFVSPPLAAQTIPATANSLLLQAGLQTSNASTSPIFFRFGCLAVWRPSTGALVGRLLDKVTTGGGASSIASMAWHQSSAAGLFDTPAAALTIQDNDVLIFEMWVAVTQSMSTAYTTWVQFDGVDDFTSDGTAESSAAAVLLTPTIYLLGESAPVGVSSSDSNSGSANESAYVEVTDFPQNGVIDNFNRADGILTSPWVGMTVPTQTYLTPYVSSNQASTGPPGNGCGAYRSDQSLTDCEAYIDLPNPSESQYHDVWLRFTPGTDVGAQNGYYLRHDSTNNKLMLQKVSGGSSSTVGGQPTCALSPGDSIGARVLGTTFTIYYKPLGAAKWRVLGTGTDATYQNAGATGFFSPGHPTVFDNFGGGSIKTNVSASDTNGTTTESGSYKGQYSDTDATGINEIEVVTLVGKLGDTDTNGYVEVATSKTLQLDIDTTISESETATATPATQVSGTDANGAVTENGSVSTFPTNGLILHFDASTLGLANGADVNPWPNLATPAIPGTVVGTPNPTFQTGQINDGKGVVRFKAGAGRVRVSSTGVSVPMTLLVVAHHNGAAATQQRIISTNYPPNNFLLGWWGPAGGPGYQDAVYDGGWAAGEPSVTANNQWKLYSFDQVGANPVRLFSDGILTRNGGSGSQNLGGSLNISGQDATATTETSDCEVAEVFVYSRQLSDTERQLVENYLRNKWFRNPQTVLDSNAPVSEVTAPVRITDTDSNLATTETAGYVVNIIVYEPDFVDSYNTLATLYSPYSSIPATFSSYNTLTGAPLPLPNLVEATTISQKYSDIDANGTTTESASVTREQITDVDATGINEIEVVSVVAKITDTDVTIVETEAVSIAYLPVSADANSVTTESASITREQITTADTNSTTTESGSVTRGLLTDVDAGTGSDTATVGKALVSDVDANGTTTESASYNVAVLPVSSSDVNGATTESAAIRQTSADVNGTTTETQALVAQALVTTDTGTGSDTQVLAAGNTPVSTDAGAITDTASVTKAAVNDSDSGTGAESATAKVAVSDSDGGTVASETVTTNVPVSASDVAGAAESAAGVAALPATDAGSATETGTPVAQVSTTDSNGATAETTVLSTHYQVADSDTATASDGYLLIAKLAVADAGSVTETSVGTAALITVGDQNGVVAENAALVTTPLITTDSGTTTETTSPIRAVLTVTDSGTSTELAAAGTANTPVSFDSATIVENASLGKYTSDLVYGLDTAILHAWLSDDDFGMASDTGGQYSPFPPGDLISGKITRGLGGGVVPALAGDIVVQEHVIQGGIGSKLDGDVETIVTGRIS